MEPSALPIPPAAAVEKEILSDKEKDQLIEEVNLFAHWLKEKKIVKTSKSHKHTIEFPFGDNSWFMRVNKNGDVAFNINILNRCSIEYYKLVVLHEYFHLVVQGVPNKEDAVTIKDDFGDVLMRLLDIEADYFAALYFKEKLGYSLVRFLSLYYEGNAVFASPRLRPTKLERFIGTMLSIINMYINSEDTSNFKECDLYLPTIQAIYTENSLHVMVIKKEHIYVTEISARYEDFANIKQCYVNVDTLTRKGYIEGIIDFTFKALGKKIPDSVKADLLLI